MLLSIVTLNYKKSSLSLLCLVSLYQQHQREFTEGLMEIIVVDNDSQDGSVENIQREIKKNNYRNIHLIKSSTNGGFGKGNNLGAKNAKGDFILFLNNDTTVSDTSVLKMVEYMKEYKEVAILGGQLRNTDGSKQASSGSFYNLFAVFLLLLGFQKFGLLDKSPEKVSRVDWVKGGLMMVRREVWNKLGGFDEQIFMYTEDMELCFRAKEKGFQVWFYPSVAVTHSEHGSANRSFAIIHIYKGLLYFYKKHKSMSEYQILKIMLFLKAWLSIVIGKITGNEYLVKTYKEAIKF